MSGLKIYVFFFFFFLTNQAEKFTVPGWKDFGVLAFKALGFRVQGL